MQGLSMSEYIPGRTHFVSIVLPVSEAGKRWMGCLYMARMKEKKLLLILEGILEGRRWGWERALGRAVELW